MEGRIITDLLSIWKEMGKNVDIGELKKWMQPHIMKLKDIDIRGSEGLKRLVAEVFPEGEWQGAVALNQILFLLDPSPEDFEEKIGKFLEVWGRNPVNLSALLTEWKRRVIVTNVPSYMVLETLTYDPSRPSYFDPEQSRTSIDFFLNMLRELGVDVEGLLENVKAVVGEEYVGDFLRLVDIDGVYTPEEFAKRVDVGLSALMKAREQGMDVGEIIRKWDELAEGERLAKLADAVRVTAEEFVRGRFWAEIYARIDNTPVIWTKTPESDLPERLHSLGMVEIKGGEVKLGEEVAELLRKAEEVLMKVRPAAVFPLEDIVNTLNVLLFPYGSSKDLAMRGMDVISKMHVDALKALLENEKVRENVWYAIEKIKEGVGNEELAYAVSNVVLSGFAENKDEFVQKVYNKIHEMRE